MTRYTIEIADEWAEKLTRRAEEAGMTPETVLRSSVEEWLASDRRDFESAATYVLQKNSELYRRLAG